MENQNIGRTITGETAILTGSQGEVETSVSYDDNKITFKVVLDVSKAVKDANQRIPGVADDAIGNALLAFGSQVKFDKKVIFDLIKTKKEA